ncbi:hypothetical protein NDU88_006073 [Pleurodeles waltl]|uniref:Uncharacterized protein n=1 Tax=Pleurodeles waltl TaxID=8319 RepID=A0AAV7SNR3_PLEWA|nr:hypothetical protein NDU88_006073 [Pleurodeles waltl]
MLLLAAGTQDTGAGRIVWCKLLRPSEGLRVSLRVGRWQPELDGLQGRHQQTLTDSRGERHCRRGTCW